METTTPILSARSVHICFNLRGRVLHAIRGIDLDIQQGEVLAIGGESGSGKSVFTTRAPSTISGPTTAGPSGCPT